MTIELTETQSVRETPAAATQLKGTLLVHVPTSGAPAALRVALALAKRSGAHVVGVGAEAFEPAWFAGQEYVSGSLLSTMLDNLSERIVDAKKRFEAESTLPAGHAIWCAEENFPHEAMAHHARAADWVIAVRPGKDAGQNLEPPVAELIMRCSLPVLLAPRSEAALQARRIVVGWSDTREASRAISDAMPLLMAAERVIVVAVGEGDANDSQQAGLDEVCQRLRHRGCNVTGERHAKGAKSVAADLAASAEGHGADLIVIGGYAHSRIQEWVLGGVTRDLIADCPTYVLFSH